MFLRLTSTDGTYEDLILSRANPRKPIRLAIGEPGRSSSIWRIWANRDKADVYIAVRHIAGVQKISLHESGDWRHQWADSERAMEFTGDDERIIDRWTRPTDPEHGHTTGFSIWVPHGHLDDLRGENQELEKDVLYLPEPPEGQLAGMHITVSAPERPATGLQGAVPLTGFALAPNPRHPTTPDTEEAVLVWYSQREFTEADKQRINDALRKMSRQLGRVDDRLREELGRKDSSVRLGLHAHRDDGARYVYELSARKISAE